jgi:cellulose 1,4-beta-cellobiosidase
LTATPGIQQITLQWASSPGAAYYNVKRWNGSSYATIISPTGTSWIDTGLAVSSAYSYVVSAVNSAGQSGDSPGAAATTAPAAPAALWATPGSNQATLSWFSVNGATSYALKRLSGSGGSVIVTYWTTGTSYTEGGLNNGTTYYYVVSAANSVGTQGPNSSQVSVTPTQPDTDGDNMPDSWELQYFGNLSQSGAGDYDGDFVSNLQEYQTGTNPTIANATVRIARPRNESNFP